MQKCFIYLDFFFIASDLGPTGFCPIKDPKWKLQCRELYILNSKVYKEGWKLGVYEILKQAERVGVNSISFCLLESGKLHSAGLMCSEKDRDLVIEEKVYKN